MIFRAAICCLLTLASALTPAVSAAGGKSRETPAETRPGAPHNLIEDGQQWQPQGGAWKVDAGNGSASVTAGDTVAELASSRGIRLAGHWMSLKVVLTGDTAKAGVRFSGLLDEKDQILRLVLDASSGGLTNGRGTTLAPLPAGAFRAPVELVLTFTAKNLLIENAGARLCEVPVQFVEQEPTPSLLAERGTVEFREVIISGDPLTVEASPAPVPAPKRAPAPGVIANRPPPAEPAPRTVVDFAGADMRPLKSGWNDYFGVHVDTTPGPWKTIRQYDGPGFGMPAEGRHSGDVKKFDGPFAKMPVEVSLGDFGDWQRKDAKRLDSHIKSLIEQDRTAVFIAPWQQPFDFRQQDEVWALMKLLYGGNVGAEGRVFFQWGDDICARRLGFALNPRTLGVKPRSVSAAGRRKGAEDDVAAYVEHYFAPAVEALRLASAEIYKDPARIPVLLGSCSRPGDPKNRAWLTGVLETTIEGSIAASLKGRKVADLVDYITLDYPFYRASDANALHEIWARYGTKVKGLWVTAEYGTSGKGAAELLQSAALYLDWAATEKLDANQTRLMWNLPEEKSDKFGVRGLVRKLGETFSGPIRVGSQKIDEATLYRIAAGDGRMIIVNVPPFKPKGRKPTAVQEILISVAPVQAAMPWTARIMSEKDRKQGAEGTVVPLTKVDSGFLLKVTASPADTWAVIVETQ